jgi:hypothetical protein
MSTYSIFVRKLTRGDSPRPQLLAYDIHDREEAQFLVSSIANAYPEHGFNPATRAHWFRFGSSLHEIYAWPHA